LTEGRRDFEAAADGRGRRHAGEALVDHGSEGVEIAARVDLATLLLLGRHVAGRAERSTHVGKAGLGPFHLGDSEIEQLDLGGAVGLAREKDVARLHVAVDDAGRVNRSERIGDLGDDRRNLGGAGRQAAAEPRPQRLAFELLHHQVGRAVREVIMIEDLDHVRMPGEPERLRLATQPVGCDGVVRDGRAKELDRDRRVVREPRRLVDHAARSSTELLAEPVFTGHDRAFEEAHRGTFPLLFQGDAALESPDAAHLRARLCLPLATRLPRGTQGSANGDRPRNDGGADPVACGQEDRARRGAGAGLQAPERGWTFSVLEQVQGGLHYHQAAGQERYADGWGDRCMQLGALALQIAHQIHQAVRVGLGSVLGHNGLSLVREALPLDRKFGQSLELPNARFGRVDPRHRIALYGPSLNTTSSV